jgi:hypothetical protein
MFCRRGPGFEENARLIRLNLERGAQLDELRKQTDIWLNYTLAQVKPMITQTGPSLSSDHRGNDQS